MRRVPMTPVEFDAACRALEAAEPALSAKSGTRSEFHDERLTASGALSKHRRRYAMARDYGDDALPLAGSRRALELEDAARQFGLWATYHDAGWGPHLHVQGLPPGEAPDWWLLKYANTEGGNS